MRSYIIAFLMLFSFTLSIVSNAEETTPDIVIEMTPSPIDEKGKIKDRGNRMPAHRVICIISADYGVGLSGTDSSEIESYEIWNPTGENLINSYTEESLFIRDLFSLKGDYILTFRTEFRIFNGFIRI